MTLKENIDVRFTKAFHGEEREQRKGGRDSKMTISLFLSTLISVKDNLNHMLAAVLGEKTEQKKKEARMMYTMRRIWPGQKGLVLKNQFSKK